MQRFAGPSKRLFFLSSVRSLRSPLGGCLQFRHQRLPAGTPIPLIGPGRSVPSRSRWRHARNPRRWPVANPTPPLSAFYTEAPRTPATRSGWRVILSLSRVSPPFPCGGGAVGELPDWQWRGYPATREMMPRPIIPAYEWGECFLARITRHIMPRYDWRRANATASRPPFAGLSPSNHGRNCCGPREGWSRRDQAPEYAQARALASGSTLRSADAARGTSMGPCGAEAITRPYIPRYE